MPKILFTVGGTGGHIYPALSLAQQLKLALPGADIQFIGGNLSTNRYFKNASFPFQSISCGSFSTMNPLKIAVNIGQAGRGFIESRRFLREFHPAIVIGFGSYHTFPVLLAAKSAGIPFLLHESNSIPGKVNRLMAPYALLMGIHFPQPSAFLRCKTIEVAMPLRENLRWGSVTREAALEYYGLDSHRPTLLAFGGSQGAHRLNLLVQEALSLRDADLRFLQIIQLTGTEESAEAARRFYSERGIRACVKPFEQNMELAWQAADLVISRSGAGTLAEQIEFGVPGILVPYPHASDNHQERNAEFLVHVVKGGEMHIEKELEPLFLNQRIASFFEHDSSKLHVARRAIETYRQTARPADFCRVIVDILSH